MIKYSIQDGTSPAIFKPVEAKLTEYITTSTWSPGIFKNNHRLEANFLEASVVGLDIDEGCSLEDAIEKFKDYKHLIATTKSHQIKKNGTVEDRFRVVLFLSESIKDSQVYRNTWHKLHELFPFIDIQAKDPARMFYPCVQVVSGNSDGLTIDPVLEAPKTPDVPKFDIDLGENRGSLSRQTLEFMLNGAAPGSWNGSLYKAAKDFQEQGYDETEFLERAEKITGHLDENDSKTIESAYKDEPKYGPRITETEMVLTPAQLIGDALNYLLDPVQVKGESTGILPLDKLLGGGIRKGEVTVLHAEAKSGKSSLFHDIIYRQAHSGLKVGYASREMRPSVEVLPNLLSCHFNTNMFLAENIKVVSSTEIKKAVEAWKIYFAGGFGLFDLNMFKAWAMKLKKDFGVSHFYMDHLHFMLEDPEDHQAASRLVKGIKTFAIEEDVAIFLIIQPNKLMEGQKLGRNTLKGGSAIGQACDNLITMTRIPKTQFIDENPNVSKIAVEFARHKVARTGSFHLEYDNESMTFKEIILENDEAFPRAGEYTPRSLG